MNNKSNIYYLYILRSEGNKLYIGQTSSLDNRQDYHRRGVASKFTAQNPGPYKLVYTEEFESRASAMAREMQLKGWTRAKKEALIVDDLYLLKKL